MHEFTWDEKTELAAQLIAQGNLTQQDIADRVGVVRLTLYSWRKRPEFQAKVDEILAEFRSEIRRLGIATVERRIHAVNDRWNRMRQLIEARAEDATMRDVPGGSTGLLARSVKGVGSGDDFQLVDVYTFDAALVKELRDHEKQAAQELGQWSEKQEITGANGAPLAVIKLGVSASMDDL